MASIYYPHIHTTAPPSSRSESPDTLSKPSFLKQLLSSPKSRRKKELQQLQQEKSKPVQRYTPETASEDLYTLPDKKLGNLAPEVGGRRREGGGKERGRRKEGEMEKEQQQLQQEKSKPVQRYTPEAASEDLYTLPDKKLGNLAPEVGGRWEGGRWEGEREEGEMERGRGGEGGGRKEGREGSKGGREKGGKQGMEGVRWRKAWCKGERPNS